MSGDRIVLSCDFPVSSSTLYEDWLSSEHHSSFTGGEAKISPTENSPFSAWDEYISGKILELEYGKRILHSWRTTEFPESSSDSMLQIQLNDTTSGCTLELTQWDIPSGDGKKYELGWKEYYFDPMTAFYNK